MNNNENVVAGTLAEQRARISQNFDLLKLSSTARDHASASASASVSPSVLSVRFHANGTTLQMVFDDLPVVKFPMPVEGPASNVYGSEVRDEDDEYEYEEVEEEIEVEEEVEVEDEEEEIVEEESEVVDDDNENGDLIEDDVNKIHHQSAEGESGEEVEEGNGGDEANGSEEELEEVEECEDLDDKEENEDLIEVIQMDHEDAEEEGEELEKVDNETKKGDFIKELMKDIVDQNVEEEEVEVDEQDDDEVEEEVWEEEEVVMEVESEEGDGNGNTEELFKYITQLDQDASQILERHEPVEDFGLCSGLQRNLAADAKAVESCAGNYGNSGLVGAREKEDPQLHGIVIVEDHRGGAPLDENWKTSENNGVFGELNSRTLTIDASSKVADNYLLFKKEPNQTAGEDPKQVAPRARLRSLTPDECSGGCKRQAVLCDLFSKGWCIKGNSCRFLHVRDHAFTYQPSEGIIHVAEKKNELLDDEVSSIHKNHQHIGRESPKEKSEMHKVSLGSPVEICKSTLKREHEKGDECQHDALPVDKGSLFDGNHSSCSLKSMEVSVSKKFSSDLRYLEDMTCKRGYVSDSQNSSATNTPGYKQPLPFGYSTGYTVSLSSQKLCDSHKENPVSISNSLKQSSFFEFDGPSKSYCLVDSQRLAELRSKMRYDWIPSVPYRPSFFITQRLLTSLNLYDPVRNSIEQTGSDSILGTKACTKADLVQEAMSGLEYSSSKYPISGQNSNGKIATKQIPENNEFVLDGEGMDSVENTPRQDIFNSKVVSEDYKINNDRRQGEGFRCNAEAKRGDQGEQEKEADAGLRVDGGSVLKESRVFKYFHSGLVEFVKELLRPMWHGGHLSKDSYKVIVKKVVDKVMVTLQPHQIPSTSESVEHYLASSQSKLTKLVEGYVDRHRKS